jgi:hypothetical protein
MLFRTPSCTANAESCDIRPDSKSASGPMLNLTRKPGWAMRSTLCFRQSEIRKFLMLHHPSVQSGRMFLAIAFCAMTLPGCATIVHGTSQSVEIRSAPHGANVLVDGRNVGTTPMKADLKRGQPHVVQIEKPGYLTESVMTTTKLNSATGWNALFGAPGGIAMIVDYSNGSSTDVAPNAVNVDLVQQVTPPSVVRPAGYVPSNDAGRARLQ